MPATGVAGRVVHLGTNRVPHPMRNEMPGADGPGSCTSRRHLTASDNGGRTGQCRISLCAGVFSLSLSLYSQASPFLFVRAMGIASDIPLRPLSDNQVGPIRGDHGSCAVAMYFVYVRGRSARGRRRKAWLQGRSRSRSSQEHSGVYRDEAKGAGCHGAPGWKSRRTRSFFILDSAFPHGTLFDAQVLPWGRGRHAQV